MPRTQRTDEKRREKFLASLAAGGSITMACKASGLPRRTAYDWRKAQPSFALAWDEAVEAGTDLLEDEAIRRARDGVEKPIYQGGKLVGHTHEYSDTLLIFTLKARRPEKFRDNSRVELTGKDGGPIQTEETSALDLIRGRIAGIAGRAAAHGGSEKPH